MWEFTIKKLIQQEIVKRKDIYKTSPDDMISAYNREIGAEKEYNGRQLLELLQNADDEKSDEVTIELDTNENILKIANRGNNCKSFSFDGIKSLMISNLSPKVTKNYIGNKGLGFRSIINWSKKITINSNNIDIVFSREIVDKIYDELFDENQKKEILEQRNLPDNVKPIPFLAIPEIQDNIQNNWTTIITIEYNQEFFKDIQDQINDLKDEVLLFIYHINKLDVKIDRKSKTTQRIKENNLIYTNDNLWTIYKKSDVLPKKLWDKKNEEEYFELKIALHENLQNINNLLFSYFPTKIDINFPFIIHGTFDLNSSRNALNKNDKNKYILKKLVELIVETAKSLTKKDVSYKALEILNYKNKNNFLDKLDFYNGINDLIDKSNIFPCIDNQYRKKDEVFYINDEFSIFIEKTNNQSLFPNMLKAINNAKIDLSEFRIDKRFDDNSIINQLSKKIDNVDDRVELIYLMEKYYNQEKFELLIDNNNNFITIEDNVYTPSKLSFNIPDFVKIKFIHRELFDKLIEKFKILSNKKARDLQRKLKDVTNIQSYEPAQVLQKIITATNKELEKVGVDKINTINKMVVALYENYKNLSDSTKIPENTKIQLISKNNEIVNANELYLSKTYPSGELTEELFGEIFKDNQFLADIEIFDFDSNEDKDQIERFFQWLAVNRYTKYDFKTNDTLYEDFVFGKINKPTNYRNCKLRLKYIVGFDKIIGKLSNEKLILWILKDDEIRKQLDDSSNTDTFKYDKKGETYEYYRHTIYTKSSYITYQLNSSKVFEDYLITNDKLNSLINTINFNFDFELFSKYNVNRADIESIMLKIGAKDKFEKLSIDRVRDILRDFPIKSKDGKQTQTIYKLSIKHYEKNKKELNNSQLLLYATKSDNSDYYNQNEIYYNGNIKLPKKITYTKAVLNYPRRQNTKNVINFFGINNLNSLKIDIIDKKIIENITNVFDNFFKQIMPYILVYRIKDIEDERTAKTELNKLKKISIKLCESVIYKIDNENFELENNDYVKIDNSYLIKIDKSLSIQDLRQDFDFSETFADIVGLVFDITETKVFRDILKDGVSYIEKTIRSDIGNDEIIRARELLGVSDEYYSFWKTIYSIKNKYCNHNLNENLLEKIKVEFNLITEIEKIDYADLRSLQSCKYIEKLFNELDLVVENFNKSKFSYYKFDLKKYHKENFKQRFDENLKIFKQNLYKWCKDNQKEKEYLSLIGKYEHNEDFIEEQSSKLSEQINVDYQKIIEKFVKENFIFKLLENMDNEIDFDEIYEINKAKINFDKIDGSFKYMSLLYFEDKVDKIQKYIESLNKQENSAEKEANHNIDIKPIIDAKLSTPTNPIDKKTKTSTPRKHGPKADKRKKESGNKAERDAYYSIVDEYGKGNVEWVSKRDDNLGYDIKYKNLDNIWKYVEVKKYSNHLFYLSKNEKKFAEEHSENYEIFLVGDEIYKITDIDFSNEKKFKLLVNEFVVFYEVQA